MRFGLPRRRVWRVAIYLGSFLLVLAAADMVLVQMRRTIRPGFDTTRIVAPLREDGAIDYLAAVDAHFGENVTHENNAAGLMLQALGRKAIPKYQPPDALTDVLGIGPLPEQGDYFIPFDEFSEKHSKTPTEWTDLTHPRAWPMTFDEVTTQWIQQNEKPLALISEASKRPRFFIPMFAGYRPETMIEIQLPYCVRYRDLSRALTTRSLMRLAKDDVDGFCNDLSTAHRMARLVGQQCTMVERMVAIVSEISACEAERTAIASGKISASRLRTMAMDLQSLGDLPSMDDALDMGERYFALDILQVFSRRGPVRAGELLNAVTGGQPSHLGPPSLFLFVPVYYEGAMRSVNHYDDGVLAALRRSTYLQRVEALTLSEKNLHTINAGELTVFDLMSADWPVKIFAPALRRALDRQETARIEGRLTVVALQLAAFKAEHGAYPVSLAELVPAYLPQIPVDSFSDKPLNYVIAAGHCTLYSVGPNMKDDGGSMADNSDDIVAHLP